MELAPAGIQLTFEVTFYASGLPVAMSVYDTTASPVLVSGPTAMSNLVANTYIGKFTPAPAKAYVILKAVYTDDTYTTLDPNYSQGTESIISQESGGGSGSSSADVIGFVIPDVTVIGLVEC